MGTQFPVNSYGTSDRKELCQIVLNALEPKAGISKIEIYITRSYIKERIQKNIEKDPEYRNAYEGEIFNPVPLDCINIV